MVQACCECFISNSKRQENKKKCLHFRPPMFSFGVAIVTWHKKRAVTFLVQHWSLHIKSSEILYIELKDSKSLCCEFQIFYCYNKISKHWQSASHKKILCFYNLRHKTLSHWRRLQWWSEKRTLTHLGAVIATVIHLPYQYCYYSNAGYFLFSKYCPRKWGLLPSFSIEVSNFEIWKLWCGDFNDTLEKKLWVLEATLVRQHRCYYSKPVS